MEHPLKAYRKKTGVSLASLAKRASTTKSTLSRIEGGKQNPSMGLVRRLSVVTGGELTANDFLQPIERPAEAAA